MSAAIRFPASILPHCLRCLVAVLAGMTSHPGCALDIWGEYSTEPGPETEKRAATLRSKAYSGDVDAVRELGDLPPEVATRFLASAVARFSKPPYRETSPELFETARSTIKHVDGYTNFFADRIETLTNQLETARARSLLIERLGVIGGDEAIDLLAKLALDRRMAESEEYIIDFFNSLQPGDDSFPDYSPNSPIAIRTLGGMKIPDAPKTDKPYYHYGLKEMELWEDWAKARLENKKKAVTASTNRPSLAENGTDRESPDPRHLRTFLLVALVLLLVAISVGMAMGGRKNA